MISSIVSGLLHQLQIFWELNLIRLFKAFCEGLVSDRLHKLNPYEISGQAFGPILSFHNDSWLQVVLNRSLHKNIQLMLKFLKAPVWVLYFSFYTSLTFLLMLLLSMLFVIIYLHIFICTVDTTLYSKCDQAADLWQQLELASELESDLQHTTDCGRKWLSDFNTRKA